jgi:hypothetical protein
MNNIHVRRFLTPYCNVQGLVEPEDKSWLVSIDDKDEATFWRQCPVDDWTLPTEQHGYVDAELPGRGRLHLEGVPVVQEALSVAHESHPLDFTVTPSESCALTRESDPPGFWAMLNARDVACFGATEHEAIRALMNYVAQLCTAGCLDHTGRPMPAQARRRYDAVFPPVPQAV